VSFLIKPFSFKTCVNRSTELEISPPGSPNASWICGSNGVGNESAFTIAFADSTRFNNGIFTDEDGSITTSSAPSLIGTVVDTGNTQFMSLGCYSGPAGRRALSTRVLTQDILAVQTRLNVCSLYRYMALRMGESFGVWKYSWYWLVARPSSGLLL
jgi:hypothetical protein